MSEKKAKAERKAAQEADKEAKRGKGEYTLGEIWRTRNALPELLVPVPGRGTQDTETEYVGIMGDEAPWAMHYKGGIVNPVNSLGYTTLAIQALEERVRELEAQLAGA
uniref:Uncharacterized protein n=1 Tax=viral metagenome TaxID=1070528 RepID=A0A6M3LCA9_9ZZZZ